MMEVDPHILLAALYLTGVGITFALLVAAAQGHTGGAPEEAVSVRAGLFALIWPYTLGLVLLAAAVLAVGEWIRTGRIGRE